MPVAGRPIPMGKEEAFRVARPRVLLIEDDALVRSLLAEELRDQGAIVIEAATGDAAHGFFAAGNVPDLIFSDVRLPGTLNGVDFARHVRRHYPALPIILTSGFPGTNVGDIGPIIQKPYKITEVVALIFDQLGISPHLVSHEPADDPDR